MRIILVFPPDVPWTSSPPLGLAYLAAVLENAKHQVKILDSSVMRLSYNDTINEILRFKPDIVGVTTQTVFYDQVKKLTKLIRLNLGDVKIVLGGPHATVFPKQTLLDTGSDLIVIGEGEKTIVELVETIDGNLSLGHIKGIAYRTNHPAEIKITEKRDLIKDLDSLPFPAIHLLPIRNYSSDYKVKQQPSTSIIASRGCPFNCLFCSVRAIWGRTFRIRSPKNVIEEMLETNSKFGIKEFFFQDECLTLSKAWILEFCERLTNLHQSFSWKCLSRVDVIDRNILEHLKRAGCHTLCFGIESGNQEILDKIRKGITLEQVNRAFQMVKEYGFDTHAYFMIGNIDENLRTMKDTLVLAKCLNPDSVSFTIASPLPGSDFYNFAKERGLMTVKDWKHFDYYSDAIIRTEDLSRADLLLVQRIVTSNFYGFKYLKDNVLKKISNNSDLMGFKKLFIGFALCLREFVRRIYFKSFEPYKHLYRKLRST